MLVAFAGMAPANAMKGECEMGKAIRIAIVAAAAALGLLLAASAANAGDPSQWGVAGGGSAVVVQD